MVRASHEVTRIESFSDAVFAFALTLLVVSLEVPKTLHELTQLVRGFLPFGATFVMVCWIWYQHHVFFRSYAITDGWTATLNSALLFVVLFYVYPLKYVTLGGLGRYAGVDRDRLPDMGDGRLVMYLYGAGVIAIFGLFALLYQRAWAQREALGLTPEETLSLRYGQRAHVLSALIGTFSVIVLLVLRVDWAPAAAGVSYCLFGPFHTWNGRAETKAVRKLRSKR